HVARSSSISMSGRHLKRGSAGQVWVKTRPEAHARSCPRTRPLTPRFLTSKSRAVSKSTIDQLVGLSVLGFRTHALRPAQSSNDRHGSDGLPHASFAPRVPYVWPRVVGAERVLAWAQI